MNSEFPIPKEVVLKSEGGQRTHGVFKVNSLENILISVVTIVFNGSKELEKTIESVLNQSYENIEYIIIDGGSSDGTLEIIRKYESRIDYWVSQKDNGIYDAMNKGIELASGQWLNFMNCGDRFFSERVLESVFRNQNRLDKQILYGNWEVRYPDGKKRMAKPDSVEELWKGSRFCHQSVFISSHYHKSHPYNIQNKIVADFEFFHSAWKNKQSFEIIDEVVSSIESGGISDLKRIDVIRGWWEIVDKNLVVNFYYSLRISREIWVRLIKRFTT